jgi:hypothetical protein
MEVNAFRNTSDEPLAMLYKMDHPRPIDRYIDYFGEPRGR